MRSFRDQSGAFTAELRISTERDKNQVPRNEVVKSEFLSPSCKVVFQTEPMICGRNVTISGKWIKSSNSRATSPSTKDFGSNSKCFHSNKQLPNRTDSFVAERKNLSNSERSLLGVAKFTMMTIFRVQTQSISRRCFFSQRTPLHQYAIWSRYYRKR